MVEDTPDDLVFELHNEAMWGHHPYGYSILGTRETVSALGVRELRELHGRAYHPPQLVVACAGNVEHERLLELILAELEIVWSDHGNGDDGDAGQRLLGAHERRQIVREHLAVLGQSA